MTDACERCGHVIKIGDWPTCRGKAEDHGRQHGGWAWGDAPPGSRRPLVLGEDLSSSGKVSR